MTPEERSVKLASQIMSEARPDVPMHQQIAQAIRDAVAEEREACAKVLESRDRWSQPIEHRQPLIDAIRARKP